jgi:hypothetical protein
MVCRASVKLLIDDVRRNESGMVAIVGHVKAAERGTFAIVPLRVVALRFRVCSLACALDVVRVGPIRKFGGHHPPTHEHP